MTDKSLATRHQSSIKDLVCELVSRSLSDGRKQGTSLENARTLVRQTSSALWEERPQSPQGWSALVAVLASLLCGYELKLQKQLTCPPLVFRQEDPQNELMNAIYQRLIRHEDSILRQPIQPSLWVGTRGALSSGLAVVWGHPRNSDNHLRFRELVTMPVDGATLALDWEAPKDTTKTELLNGPIQKPVVLVLHGLNNDTSCSYIKSLQRTFTNRGYVAVGMNFRGCGGVPLSTPRPYNGAYTGDLRSVVYTLEGRLAPDVPLFLVGNSLGGNFITKYLGEEGLSGTLPSCVKGGVSLSNPLHIHSKNNTHTPMTQLMAWGVKLKVVAALKTWRKTLVYPEFRKAILGMLTATTIDQVDEAMIPVILRNEPVYPFAVHIGYESAEEYWNDCSSYRFVNHVSVPLLQIIAGDDPVVYKGFQQKLAHCSLNPNVMSVETKCGGHLGWQESPPPNNGHDNDDSGFQPTWAGRAAADFIDAILRVGPVQPTSPSSVPLSQRDKGASPFAMARWEVPPKPSRDKDRQQVPVLRSKL